MFATLATGIFRNSPWHLGQGNLLTILFIADNFTCTIETYYGSHHLKSKNWSNTQAL